MHPLRPPAYSLSHRRRPTHTPYRMQSWLLMDARGHTPTLRSTVDTPRTLAKFDGLDGRKILFAITGIVFDVNWRRRFLRPRSEHLVTFFDLLEQKGGQGD